MASRRDAATLARRDIDAARSYILNIDAALEGRYLIDKPEVSAAAAVRYLKSATNRLEKAFKLDEVPA